MIKYWTSIYVDNTLRRNCIILVSLFCCLLSSAGQTFDNIDWRVMESDTLLPYYTRQLNLADGYELYDYDVKVEFPVLVPLTDYEKSLWNVERNASCIEEMPDISHYVSTSRGSGFLDVGFVPIVKRNGVFCKIVSFKLLVERRPVQSSSSLMAFPPASSSAPETRYVTESVLNHGYWYKIRIKDSGVYRMSESFLSQIGFDNPDKVRLYGSGGTLLPETDLEYMADDLKEIPLWRENDALFFYARGPLSWTYGVADGYTHKWNTYSSYGYYFLTSDDNVIPAEVGKLPVVESEDVELVETTPEYALYEKDAFSWYHGGRTFFDGYDYSLGASQNYSFRLEDITDDNVRVTVRFSSSGNTSSSLETRVNGTLVGTMSLSANAPSERAAISSASYLCSDVFNQDNIIQLYHKRQDGISGRLDFIRLNYTRNLVMHGSYMNFRVNRAKNASFKISANGNIKVWNIASDGSVRLVPSNTENGYCITKGVGCKGYEEFVAVDINGDFPEPEKAGRINNQNLHGYDQVDMVIIVPASGLLTQQAERLADAHRTIEGMSVIVVSADQVYNEFSSGTPDATAYRRFLKMLYDRGGKNPRLKYLLLFGNGAWDNRMLTSAWNGKSPDDYLLCYEAENSINEIKSYVAEDYFALLEDGKGGNLLTQKVDIGVGRFPVVSVTEAATMVDKTISYINGDNAGEWQNSVVILGDDGDRNLHMTQADRLAEMILSSRPSLNVRKMYWDAYKMESSAAGNTYPELHREILRQMEKGALLFNYTGHGSASILSHEMVLRMEDFATISSPRLPLWVTASCDISPFDNPSEMIGRSALLNKKGGAVAMFTTTRTVYSQYNEHINNLFDQYVLDSGNRLGDAVRLAKVQLVSGSGPADYSENKLNYVLLGDPAMRLAMPQDNIVVDSIITDSIAGDLPVAQAGGKARVKGHLESAGGVLLKDFSGVIASSVFDSRRKITGHNNAGDADTAFWFYDYDRLLFSGQDSIRNGGFSLEFPVPKDINYSNEHGRIVLYSKIADDRAANGWSCDFLVGGTSPSMPSDSLGPKISVYLNAPDFEYWGKVNSTPCLVAEIEDPDGINATGNGIGHDMMLIIDNGRYSYVLNGYYSPIDGNYRHGRIIYPIPSLPDGRHTLILRVWDILNNSSTATLGFEVDSDVPPQVKSVIVNSGTDKRRTSFVINHDRPGSLSTVDIEVIDANGRVVWTNSVKDNALSGVCVIDWNECSDSGQLLRTGLYIYRVSLIDNDGISTQFCGKLVLL